MVKLDMQSRRERLLRGLGWVAIAGMIALPVTDIIGIMLRPGYNPIYDSVSQLALGPTGWVQNVGLCLGGIGMLAFALGLALKLPARWEIRLGEVLLALIGAGFLLTGILPTSPLGQARNVTETIHLYAGFISGGLSLPAFFLIAPGIRDKRRLFVYTIIAGIFQVALAVGRGELPAQWSFFGLRERLITANGACWAIIIAWSVLLRDRLTGPQD